MHDAGRHFLRQGEITSRQGLFVNSLGFFSPCSASSHFVGLEFGGLPVKDVDRFDAHAEQRGRAMKKAHQVRHGIAVGVPEGHTVALWRTVSHGGEELKGGEKSVNANSLSRERLQRGLFSRRDVLQIAAHGPDS